MKKHTIEVLGEAQVREIERIVAHESAEYINALPKLLKTKLNSIVAQIAGFEEDRWGNAAWKVDHCNSRQSTVSKFLHDATVDALDKAVGQIGAQFELSDEMKTALQKDYLETLYKNLRQALRDQAVLEAKRMATNLLADVIVEPIITPVDPKRAADPEFGGTGLEQLALQKLAKQAIKAEQLAKGDDREGTPTEIPAN